LIGAEAGWCWTADGGGQLTTAVDGSGLWQSAVGNGGRKRRSETAADGGDKLGGRRRFDGRVIAGSGGVDGVDGWILLLFFFYPLFYPRTIFPAFLPALPRQNKKLTKKSG
jgi:hypothetical protein